MHSRERIALAVALAGVVSLGGAAPAAAATGSHVSLVTAGILGDIFGTLGHAVLGAFTWTIGLASSVVFLSSRQNGRIFQPNAGGCGAAGWVGSFASRGGQEAPLRGALRATLSGCS